MTSNTQPEASKVQASSTGMGGEIQKQWSKFTYGEVAALKSKDELVTKVQSKYALDKAKAQSDVDAFAKGRQL